jgi:hypothetical protein
LALTFHLRACGAPRNFKSRGLGNTERKQTLAGLSNRK